MPLRVCTSINKIQQDATVCRYLFTAKSLYILDFKLSPCSKCCMLSSGLFQGVWILCVDVSEHSACSIFIDRWLYEEPSAYEDGTECSETSTHKIQTPGNNPEESIHHSACFGCPSHPSSGEHKTVTAASATGHIIWATTFLQRGL